MYQIACTFQTLVASDTSHFFILQGLYFAINYIYIFVNFSEQKLLYPNALTFWSLE